MLKLKHGIVTVLGFLIILYTHTSYAGACVVPPAHINGVVTLHISKYGVNYPLTRNDYKFGSAISTITCPFAMGAIRLTGSKSLVKSSDIQGNDAWALNDAGQTQNPQPQFALEPSMRTTSSPNTSYADGYYSNGTYLRVDSLFQVDLVTLSGTTLHNDGDAVTFTVPDPVIYIGFTGEDFITEYPAAYLDSLTIKYIVTSCGIKSKQGSIINWPSLYKKDIVNGTAESKPYSLSLICGKESDTPLPINISFSSTNGFADAANGVVRTNLDNLGLKLSWANPALPPLELNKVNHTMLAGVGDYSVLAKPIKISGSTGTLEGGQFDTTVTMNIEFQ